MQKLPNTRVFFRIHNTKTVDANDEISVCTRGVCVRFFFAFCVENERWTTAKKKNQTKQIEFYENEYAYTDVVWSARWTLLFESTSWLCTSYASFIYKYELLLARTPESMLCETALQHLNDYCRQSSL